MSQSRYFDLLDWLENEKLPNPDDFFHRLQDTYGIAQVIYVDARLSPLSMQINRLHHTLTRQQAAALADLGTPLLTSVLSAATNAVRPLDWNRLIAMEPKAALIAARLSQLGLPEDGLTFPLPSRAGRSALLSISMASTHRDWRQFCRLYGRDIQALAAQFHAALLDGRTSGGARETPGLTERERETLAWAAAGKSYWEIAAILGISERTVRFFMANARRKLDVVTNAQAVAKAIWEGLIARP
ncbi:LuxR C-terminal-related transcriptional regulator [Rhizobium sp. RU36D]|uniref:helix-turn-helix transcriptional regulator n=1 Tax=Rhizobium sp. RU36D TaxID=1907415 RepID=UPI0009D7AEAA|nr:LuxR C-terminal-related transcriptional regulator [Rhizobium sp. RU36D]SMC80848.1 LuxR family transcriptional regulator, quorum-sensing system regulator SinR [Rhizobium sp. RU36D]